MDFWSCENATLLLLCFGEVWGRLQLGHPKGPKPLGSSFVSLHFETKPFVQGPRPLDKGFSCNVIHRPNDNPPILAVEYTSIDGLLSFGFTTLKFM